MKCQPPKWEVVNDLAGDEYQRNFYDTYIYVYAPINIFEIVGFSYWYAVAELWMANRCCVYAMADF